MSTGIGKTQQAILDLMHRADGGPLTAALITAVLSQEQGRAISDRQIRRALYSLEDRGLLDLRVQPNPIGRPGICVWLPGGMAAMDEAFGGVPRDARPTRPPKTPRKAIEGDIGGLARAAEKFAVAQSEEDRRELLAELLVIADGITVRASALAL